MDPVLFADGSVNYDACFRWTLSVRAHNWEIDGRLWHPIFLTHDLSIVGRDWRWLSGKTFDSGSPLQAWKRWSDGDYGYVCEEVQFLQSELLIGAIHGSQVDIDWRGRCAILDGIPPFDADVPFHIDARVEFRGVGVCGAGQDTVLTLRGKLSRYLNPDDFVPGELRQVSSAIVSCAFTPKT
ncbi:MAG TPA: hypothetical protein VFV70_12350 [Hyphomonadaceae bacterium]|nr:hypothetical protein [Hyphomonadaceae bacterium]